MLYLYELGNASSAGCMIKKKKSFKTAGLVMKVCSIFILTYTLGNLLCPYNNEAELPSQGKSFLSPKCN